MMVVRKAVVVVDDKGKSFLIIFFSIFFYIAFVPGYRISFPLFFIFVTGLIAFVRGIWMFHDPIVKVKKEIRNVNEEDIPQFSKGIQKMYFAFAFAVFLFSAWEFWDVYTPFFRTVSFAFVMFLMALILLVWKRGYTKK